MNKSFSKIRHIKEANDILENRVISEKISTQGTLLTEQASFLTIYPDVKSLTNVNNTSMSASGQQLKLSKRNPKNGQVIPNTTFSYNVEGSYGWFNFDVNMRNFKRNANGSLELEAKPSNNTIAYTMRKLVPKGNVTTDGWLKVLIPLDKINNALIKLFNNKGSEAEIDAGNGVTITLKNK
jgi:hypothetical protein